MSKKSIDIDVFSIKIKKKENEIINLMKRKDNTGSKGKHRDTNKLKDNLKEYLKGEMKDKINFDKFQIQQSKPRKDNPDNHNPGWTITKSTIPEISYLMLLVLAYDEKIKGFYLYDEGEIKLEGNKLTIGDGKEVTKRDNKSFFDLRASHLPEDGYHEVESSEFEAVKDKLENALKEKMCCVKTFYTLSM